MTRSECIRIKCFDCGYDELAPGTKLEQIAACTMIDCGLYSVRPLPRHCRTRGKIEQAAVDAIVMKLEAIDRRWASEGR